MSVLNRSYAVGMDVILPKEVTTNRPFPEYRRAGSVLVSNARLAAEPVEIEVSIPISEEGSDIRIKCKYLQEEYLPKYREMLGKPEGATIDRKELAILIQSRQQEIDRYIASLKHAPDVPATSQAPFTQNSRVNWKYFQEKYIPKYLEMLGREPDDDLYPDEIMDLVAERQEEIDRYIEELQDTE